MLITFRYIFHFYWTAIVSLQTRGYFQLLYTKARRFSRSRLNWEMFIITLDFCHVLFDLDVQQLIFFGLYDMLRSKEYTPLAHVTSGNIDYARESRYEINDIWDIIDLMIRF